MVMVPRMIFTFSNNFCNNSSDKWKRNRWTPKIVPCKHSSVPGQKELYRRHFFQIYQGKSSPKWLLTIWVDGKDTIIVKMVQPRKKQKSRIILSQGRYLTQKILRCISRKKKFFLKILNCAWFMSNPASRSGKLLIWYLPANDIHQKKEDLETSWKLRDWWNFLDLKIFVSIQNWFFL